MVQMVSEENNNRRVTKPELKARIKELEKRLMFIEKYLMEKASMTRPWSMSKR